MKAKGLTLKISLTDTEIFKELLDVLKEATEDERIDAGIRLEMTNKILAIGEKADMKMEGYHA